MVRDSYGGLPKEGKLPIIRSDFLFLSNNVCTGRPIVLLIVCIRLRTYGACKPPAEGWKFPRQSSFSFSKLLHRPAYLRLSSPPRALSSTPLNASNVRAPPPFASFCALFFSCVRSLLDVFCSCRPRPTASPGNTYIRLTFDDDTRNVPKPCAKKTQHTHTHIRTDNTKWTKRTDQTNKMKRTDRTNRRLHPCGETKRNGTERNETSLTCFCVEERRRFFRPGLWHWQTGVRGGSGAPVASLRRGGDFGRSA